MNALEAILDAFGPLIMQYLAICAGLWMLLWAVSEITNAALAAWRKHE